jgi:phenylacetate-CoA ligase
MSALVVLRDTLRLHRGQRMDRGALRALQERKLRRVVAHAFSTVPFWRRLMEAEGIRPGDIQGLEDLRRFPITTRAMLQRAELADLTSSAFAPSQLRKSTTTGSTGRPLTIHVDARFHQLRKSMFLRALMASGYRPGEKMLLLAHEHGRSVPSWLRWRYASPDLPATELAGEVIRFAPANIYGWVTPLRQLALHLQDHRSRIRRPRRLFTTAEAVDEASGRVLDEHLGDERFAIYGSTELGTMGWECPAHQGFHLSEDTTLLEFLPLPGAGGLHRVVATSLEALGTPLIRYDTGDLALAPEEDICACGRRLARVRRFEGRLVDSIRLADGRLLSPFVLTEAIERAPDLVRYQIVQEAIDRFTVRAEGQPSDRSLTEGFIAQAIRDAVTAPVKVDVQWLDQLDPPPGRKFRVVESHVEQAAVL